MARKELTKPLFSVKADFYASLDAFVHQAMMMADAVSICISSGSIPDKASKILAERLTAFEVTLSGEKENK